MAILETFPVKPGHTITDDSSPITERESVNLIDFDVTDDSTNEQTDVTPHRLTSAELDDIVAGVPNGYNSMPVVFDERGTEYVIGTYINTDGTKQPLYQKTIIGNTGTITDEESTIDVASVVGLKLTNIFGYCCFVSRDNVAQIGFYRNDSNYVVSSCVSGGLKLRIAGSHFANSEYGITIQYIKTTDIPT